MTSIEGTPPPKPAERRRRIRRGTIAGSLATFASIWAVIFGQLVSGQDPALGKTSKTTTTQQAASPAPAQTDTYSYDDPYSDDGSYSAAPQQSAPQQSAPQQSAPLAPATTSQS